MTGIQITKTDNIMIMIMKVQRETFTLSQVNQDSASATAKLHATLLSHYHHQNTALQ